MNLCIIGHGPSIKNKPLGFYIDSFDFVIRQKKESLAMLKAPKLYGSKVDAVVGSWNQLNSIKSTKYETWIFIDSRFHTLSDSTINQVKGVKIDRGICDYWNEVYRNLRTPSFTLDSKTEKKKSSDELGHTHMSSGMHALIYACEFKNPVNVTLFGYDNIKTGTFTWSLTRGESWNRYPDHRWDIENQMLSLIEKHYNTEIHFNAEI